MQENALSTSIQLKPGVFSSYNNGWTQLWKHFLVLFLIGIIYLVLAYAMVIPQWIAQGAIAYEFIIGGVLATVMSVISFFYSLLFINPLGYGQNYAYLRAARNENVEVQDMFSVFKNYLSAVGAAILMGLIVGIGFILLIIPGIIFACKLAFVPYLVVDRRLNTFQAISVSWNMTNGHAWKVFLIGLLGIPIVIAGLICLLVGVIISFMWINTAMASLYYAVSVEKEAIIMAAS